MSIDSRLKTEHIWDIMGSTSPKYFFALAIRFVATKILDITRDVDRSEWRTAYQQDFDPTIVPNGRRVYTMEYLESNLPPRYQFMLDLGVTDVDDQWTDLIYEILSLTIAIMSLKNYLCGLYESPYLAELTVDTTRSPLSIAELPEGETECPVCKVDWADAAEPVVKTTCGHLVGKDCLSQWLEDGNQGCILCRQEFKDPIELQQRPEKLDAFELSYADIVAKFPEVGRVKIALIETIFAAMSAMEGVVNEAPLELSVDQVRSEKFKLIEHKIHVFEVHELSPCVLDL